MAKLVNLCKNATTTTGTGTITIGSAVSGWLSIGSDTSVSDGDAVSYYVEDGSSRETGTGTLGSGKTTLTRNVRRSTNGNAAISLSGNAVVSFAVGAGDILQPDEPATISKGFTITPYSIGTVSSGTTTPDASNGNYQYYTNNGAHTLAAPASDCAIDLLVTNGASAGSITFSGFTVGSSTGSSLTTTNTSKFIISIRRVNSVATYSVYALQ